MKALNITTKTEIVTEVRVGDIPIHDVLDKARVLAHSVLEEISVFKRGRNAHTNHKAKNASEGDYHYATGLESLFGWLYLKGENERIIELFNAMKSE